MANISDTIDCQSEISQFFANSNVLITGGSGFLGKLLIEKLLRCCPDIAKMYIFMRNKKGKSAEDRLKEHFNDVLYDRLRKEQPNFSKKIIMIEADMSYLNLSLSTENREQILDTTIIFHAAANVRFNESIRNAVNINVRGTKELLLFAKKMPNLKVFLYISTAFSHCVYKCIEERYYPPPMETDKMLTLLDILDNEKLDEMTSILIGKWPNSYVYTKAIAEDTVRQFSIGIPACIVRPSIVTSTAKEPMPGWIDNIYGAVGVVMGAGIGLLRTLHCVPENNAEIVPADYTVSNIIAASWDTAKRKNTLSNTDNANLHVPKTESVPIYNYVSSCQNPISWGKFMKLNEISGLQVPSTRSIWYYMLFLNRYLFVHNVCKIFLHLIPAIIVDTLAFLSGRKPILWKAYKKIHTFSTVISYFSTQQWQFHNDAVVKLWDRMNLVDQQIFYFNIQDMDWYEYLKHMIPGMRVFMVKDPMETIEKGRVKQRRLKIAHYTLTTIFTLFLIWGFLSLINYTISFL